MIHRAAESLAVSCINRNWIEPEYKAWCVYALEKRICTGIFFTIVLCWMLFTNLYVETISFLAPFYLLRRRFGGWHAKTAIQCLFISMGFIVLGTFVGSLLINNTHAPIIFADTAIILFAIMLNPAYPPQLHFGREEVSANNKIKNFMLLAFFLGQLILGCLIEFKIMVYSFLGITIATATVVIVKYKQKREGANHESI